MKQAILITSLLFIFTIAFPQKKFEGTIVYTIHDNEGKGDRELTAFFGKPGIKFKFRDKNDYDKEVLFINLDSAVIYTINESAKTFTQRKLLTRQYDQDAANRMIAGYNTKSVELTNQYGYLGLMVGIKGKLILYRSDSLFYPIPDKYSINPELL